MGRIFIDGFESGDLKLYDTINSVTIATAKKMTGSYALRSNGCFQFAVKALGATYSTIYFRFAFNFENIYVVGNSLMSFYRSGTAQAAIGLTSDRKLQVLRGNGFGTQLARYDIPCGTNMWHDIQGKLVVHDTNGIFQVKLNNILVIDYIGDTQNVAGDDLIDAVYIGQDSGSSNGISNLYIDDIALDDASWPGTTYIQAIKPNGAGNSTEWTPSAGSNYGCVDEVPPSESDYVATNTIDHLDLYTLSDLAGTIGQVKCVQVQALAKADGVPTPQNLQLSLRASNTNYFSSNKALPSVSKQLSHIWETNPATSAVWTESAVNGLEIGVKAVV